MTALLCNTIHYIQDYYNEIYIDFQEKVTAYIQ